MEFKMIKSFNSFIVLISLSLSLPTLGMEPQPRRAQHTPKPLLKTILVREAHKAESKRKEYIRQDFATCLRDKYAIITKQGLTINQICNLSEEEKASLEKILKNRAQQLFHKFSTQTGIMHSLIGTTKFNQAVCTFSTGTTQHLLSALNCADISPAESLLYSIQQSRRTAGALVWATNEIIAKYYSPKETEDEEDEDFNTNEKENINE